VEPRLLRSSYENPMILAIASKAVESLNPVGSLSIVSAISDISSGVVSIPTFSSKVDTPFYIA